MKQRVKQHGRAAAAARGLSFTFLELNAVRPATSRDYFERIENFMQWADLKTFELVSVKELDGLVCEFLEAQYFDGHNHDCGDKLIAAIGKFAWPRISLKNPCELPRTMNAAKGFKRLAPGHSRAPLPWVALVAMAAAASSLGWWGMTVALVLHFTCYLRPGELLKLKVSSVIMPVNGAGTASPSLLLSPLEGGIPGKTQEYDESVLLDWPRLPGLTVALGMLMKHKRDDDLLFNLDYRTYLEQFNRLAELTGVNILKPHPYALRHGGASHQYLTKQLAIAAIKRKGRWKADNSVRRYEKSARVAKETAALPSRTREYAMKWEPVLNDILRNKVQADAPPFLVAPSLRKRKRAS